MGVHGREECSSMPGGQHRVQLGKAAVMAFLGHDHDDSGNPGTRRLLALLHLVILHRRRDHEATSGEQDDDNLECQAGAPVRATVAAEN